MSPPDSPSSSGSSVSVDSNANDSISGSLTSDNGELLSVATVDSARGSYYDVDNDADSCASCAGEGQSTAPSLHGSTSLAPSICQHSYRFGRRYQSDRDGRYALPNDELEQEREQVKHLMILEATDGRHISCPHTSRCEEDPRPGDGDCTLATRWYVQN